MVCSPPRTPLLALNIVVGVTALALATVLATYETDYNYYGLYIYIYTYSPYARLPAIVMAYTTTALSVAYYTGWRQPPACQRGRARAFWSLMAQLSRVQWEARG